MVRLRDLRSVLFLSLVILTVPVAFAQQTGSVSGKVLGVDGQPLPGVTVEAQSPVLPQARVTTTTEGGDYRLPALAPGVYELRFSLAGMQQVTRRVQVLLGQNVVTNAVLGMAGVEETITVTAQSSLVDMTTSELKSALSNEVIEQLPVGQNYRDLVKLIPAVQYSEDAIRGPSAGGSGQDNVYQFDGVTVTLPLFGTLSSEPSSIDIDQISVIKGGARATGFNRSGGFTIDTVSKSGTSDFKGEVGYQVQTESMTAERETFGTATFEEDKSWVTFNVGGPILRDRLFFFASYFRPETQRENRENDYGPVPPLDDTKDEFFGKLTFTPTSSILVHGSYRDAQHEVLGSSVLGSSTAGTASTGSDSTLKIGIVEGSWVIGSSSLATVKFTDFANESLGRPDNVFSVQPSVALGAQLDVNSLDQMGQFTVPLLRNDAGHDAFVAPFIDKYGFLRDGARTGGGIVGGGLTLNNQDFYRQSFQVAFDHTLGSGLTHDLHFGYQWNKDEEDLERTYNGWGQLFVTGGFKDFYLSGNPNAVCPASAACAGEPYFYRARFIRGALDEFPLKVIHSEIVSHNVEVNDVMRWNDWTVSAGVLVSKDTLYGQGLKNDDSTLSGYVLSPGSKYTMYEVDWQDMIQPRLGVAWDYNNNDNVYANYARYHPAATSLPRAASWDRNTIGLFYDTYFDADGKVIGFAPVGSSSGKLFADGLKPRYTDEFLIGTVQQVNNRWTARAYGRYRYASNFWEDTNNDARVRFNPPAGVPQELYIPDLTAKRQQICQSNPTACGGTLSGSTYVIAELDGAFTKYYEATVESEWTGAKTFVRGSYTWSHYYGNFDQDNTTTGNDDNVFIGSSFLGDGNGSQIWDNRYGNLRGDRRHMLKFYGSYSMAWNATAGFYAVYQSGQPWEPWSGLSVYAEPAGSQRTDAHYQLDLNYTHTFPIGRYAIELVADLYNVLDKQTGYNIQNRTTLARFTEPRTFFSPRRVQLGARFQF